MRIGILSTHNAERIAFMKRWGLGSVELMTGYFDSPPDYMPGNPDWEAKAEAVKADFDAADIRISCVGAFYLNHFDPDIEESAKTQVRNAILLAEHLGVSAVSGFAGRLTAEPLENSVPKFADVWGEHARFADDHGVRIAFECCPMGQFHSPMFGMNCICTPAMYEACLGSVPSEALGLEWDPSHIIPQGVDPVENIRQFGSRIYHVHAKGARMNRRVVEQLGVYHPAACEHCMPGFGDEDWGQIIKELRRTGYHGDLNIEGWHDAVWRDQDHTPPSDVAHQARPSVSPNLEDAGLIIALNHLRQFCPEGF